MDRITLYAAIAVLTAAPLFAHEYKIGELVVDHPMAFETAPTAGAGGGYLTITNGGDTDDILLAVEADFPRVMLHTTEMQDGVARMKHLADGVVLPAGETVMLMPGGTHVMFMGLNGDPFEVGEAIAATLMFENAGRLEIVFNVEARKADDHSDMDHGSHGDG